MFKRFCAILIGLFLGVAILAGGALTIAVLMTYPRLPSLSVLTDYRPKIPLRVYTADQVLIGEFGEERRFFLRINDVPKMMIDALLSAEDERFYQHGGIDYIGGIRALISNVLAGKTRSGASTITMQVAKNFFLSSEKTFTRKFNEALLAFKIEHTLTKDQILELYINQIYLGQRAYGFGAAAQAYFGKPLQNLAVAEMAMLAGLPKAPSAYNPIVNPQRARIRQEYVLRRMYDHRYISKEQYNQALEQKLVFAKAPEKSTMPAQYIAEMVRQEMYDRFQEGTYTDGYRVYTTLDSRHQQWAYNALRSGLMDFDRKHGYRGPEGFINLATLSKEGSEDFLDEALADIRDSGDMLAAVVQGLTGSEVRAVLRSGKSIVIAGKGLDFVRHALSSHATAKTQIRVGSIIRVRASHVGDWEIVQLPEIEGAFVSLDPKDGAIKSLIGGFDFDSRPFNHVTQAWRQPGSSFKPFIYSAAIDRGLTTSTLINDAPFVLVSDIGQRWEPQNDDGKFLGMMTMRRALTLSRNIVSIRILQAIGVQYAQQYIQRFGFSPKQHPAYLTMALGAGSATPLQMAAGYAVFANGGYRLQPYFIDRIEDANNKVLARTQAVVAGQDAPSIDPRNAFIITSMLKDVVRYGTGRAAMALGREDLAGKTGTTNDWKDAWFVGFNPNLVAATWIGYDQPRTLGRYGYGGTAALPIWIHYMANALKGVPEVDLPIPQGMTVHAGAGLNGEDEYYYNEHQAPATDIKINNNSDLNTPEDASDTLGTPPPSTPPPPPVDAVQNVRDQLF